MYTDGNPPSSFASICPGATRQSEVSEKLGRLQLDIEDLERAVTSLEDRFAPVCSSIGPDPVNIPEAPDVITALGGELNACHNALVRIGRRLDSLLTRCEL